MNKIIDDISIDDKSLIIDFTDGSKIEFLDDGHLCCETRYMHTDDDPLFYLNSEYIGYEVKEGFKSIEPETDYTNFNEIDAEFLVIKTSKGEFTIVNYNEHNGYYEGFDIICKETPCNVEVKLVE